MLGQSERVMRRAHAHRGRLIGRRRDQGGFRARAFVERAVPDRLDLAAALADEADDRDIAFDLARELRQKARLPDAARRENADALADAEREQPVDGAHAGLEDLARRDAFQRRRGRRAQRREHIGADRAQSVARPSERIDGASEQRLAHRNTIGERARGDQRAGKGRHGIVEG